jgi:diadenosine tetraphosphate (Ap4A) HIT family hydrolase
MLYALYSAAILWRIFALYLIIGCGCPIWSRIACSSANNALSLARSRLAAHRTASVNATAVKFGDPETRIAHHGAWTVLLRPRQVTLGALVLVCGEPVTAFGQVSAQAFADLRVVAQGLERMLKRAFTFDKINYLMLMMVDPDVHFHVLPRYAQARQFAGQAFTDPAWPNAADLAGDHALSAQTRATLVSHLRGMWE